jgi:uncharacterized small protein (DUF1192 family)
MALFDDMDPFGAPPKKKTTHEIGQSLDTLSVDELDERVSLLREEIARLEAARAGKVASRAAAASVFKTG